ncbi:px domain protein [Lichtheimia corymbifera JMRC:FSU:9682]|uniref:Px domain protein n=1 Tax=Lichtheimia corymbifera JMRC:FSU:9682 TaxID=1263082 RepID=A0A068RYC0_9FUNG|nr:px domain protein [Lichtheimia corymbifera JMRC:FSU:9682]
MDLSPRQLHYFKRELLAIQLGNELEHLRRRPDLLSLLESEQPLDEFQVSDLPFLHYVFQHIVAEFPLLKNSRQRSFWSKAHQFLSEVGKIQLNTYVPSKTDASQRRAMTRKLQRTLLLALNVGVKTIQGQEESIKVTPSDLVNESSSSTTTTTSSGKEDHGTTTGTQQQQPSDTTTMSTEKKKENGLDNVNVITVRAVKETRTLLRGTVTRAEFVIRSTFDNNQDAPIHVARRHGHFRQLVDQLKNECPGTVVPMLPSKTSTSTNPNHAMYRERDRQLLSSFLRRLLSRPKLARSKALHQFLTRDPIELSEDERLDAEVRKQMDDQRAEQSQRFRKEVDDTVVALNDLLDMLKQKVMQPGGLTELMGTIKSTEQLVDLPEALRKAFEWGRISFAFALHTHFVTDDAAAENIATLRRTHSFMPYRTVATILRFSNPIAMVKMMLDLFMAQPLGGKSLFQRILMANMVDDANAFTKEIEMLEAKIDEKALCAKVRNAVSTPSPTYPEEMGSPILEVISVLQNPDIEPRLSPEQLALVSDGGGIKKTKKLLKQLYDLWFLYARKREHELLFSLAFQGVTSEILKELFAIFYEPLAQVYKAANIGESVQHLAAFMDDLIDLLDNLDTTSVDTNTVKPFVMLVQRHEQKFYQFVHRVHAQDTSHLFDELVGYVDHILGSLTRGIRPEHPLDMNDIVRIAGVTPEQYPDLRNEIDALCEYRRLQKLQHLRRTRQKVIAHQQSAAAAGGDDGKDNIDDLSVGDDHHQQLLRLLPDNVDTLGLVHEMREIDLEEEEENDTLSENGLTDDGSSTTSEELESPASIIASGKTTPLTPPDLKVIPTIVPHFVQRVADMMLHALVEEEGNFVSKKDTAV